MLFEISNISPLNSQLIVFSRSAVTISDYIFDIAMALRGRCYKGYIIFDLLLSNGLNDRYYSAYFNGKNFELPSFSKCIDISPDVISISKAYYKQNIRLLRISTLTKIQKQQLLCFLKE